MNTFTRIPECRSCKFKWVLMVIFSLILSINRSVCCTNLNGISCESFIGFEHQEYLSVKCANLNGFSWQFQLVLILKNIGMYTVQI